MLLLLLLTLLLPAYNSFRPISEFVVSIIHKFTLIPKSLIPLIHIIQNGRAQHPCDLLSVSMRSSVRVAVVHERRWRRSLRRGVPVCAAANPQGASGRSWCALAQAWAADLEVGVCGVGHLWCPGVVVLQGLRIEGVGVEVGWDGARSWCDRCHAWWVGSGDVDVHYGCVGAGFGVDVLVVWIVDSHFTAAVDNRGGQRVAARVIYSLLVVEVITQACDAVAGEDAEDVALVIVEFLRSLTAETQEFIAKERLHARERQMCEFRAVVQQHMDAL